MPAETVVPPRFRTPEPRLRRAETGRDDGFGGHGHSYRIG